MIAVAIFRHGSAVRREDEPWGQAITFSAVVHAGLLAAMLIGGAGQKPEAARILTEVNFVEKPVEVPRPVLIPGAVAPEAAVKGLPDLVEPTSPNPQAGSQIVAFSAPGPAKGAEPVAAPIIAGPIAPLGEMGAIGMKKAALAAIPSARDAAPPRRGPMTLPGTGGGTAASGAPIALATQGVDDVRMRGGGGLGVPLTTQSGLTDGSGPAGGKGGSVIGGDAPMAKRKAPVEALSAVSADREAWGKKQSPFSLEGPLKYRKIKTMRMPPYPRWAEEKGIEAAVSYRLWVDPKGRVKDNMYLEKTSGYSELDALAKEALLSFVFVPLPGGQPVEDEWGVATFKFELKK